MAQAEVRGDDQQEGDRPEANVFGPLVPALPDDAPGWQRVAHAISYHPAVQTAIVAVIIANGVVIGVQTYDLPGGPLGRALDLSDQVFLAFFVVEIALRFVAFGCRPRRYFASGWNVFDTVVVLLAFVPLMLGNTSVLRLFRVLRIARLAKVMPDVAVLLDGLRGVARPALSLVALTGLLCFLYGLVGCYFFEETDPEYFGNIGRAMLTLFELLTLEGWNDILHDLMATNGSGAVVYTISFVVVGTYVVINLMVAVVINSLDEAHRRRVRNPASATADLQSSLDEVDDLLDRMRDRVTELEQERRQVQRRGD